MSEFEGHTPGLWRLFDDDGSDAHGRLIWGGDTDASSLQGCPVAIVLPDGHEASFEANARLIAAAPTLLAQRDALAEALSKIASCEKRADGDVVDIARKALASCRIAREP